MRSLRTTALSIAAAGVVLVPMAATAGPADPAPSGTQLRVGIAGTPTGAATVKTDTVTLITGDVVTLATGPDGMPGVSTEPAPGTSPTFLTEIGEGGDTYVYPDSAGAAIASGRLDKELFNLTRLVAEGRDDAGSDTLPVIVDYAGSPTPSTLRTRASETAGVTHRTALTSIGANAVEVDKDQARAFYREVTTGPKATVRLDRQVSATLDRSVPQVGAPQVWQQGYDGSGVQVAVLDTGVDQNHPDVAEKVIAAKSFIPGQAVQDGRGHGTHVASTIAGSGAASGGKLRGVAPGADLIVGKVLDNRGNGNESGVIAGIEWAIAQGADVINLSLGTDTTEGSDPLSEAIDELSETTGTLFVISAGNEGPGSATIGTPGIAARALTVGAVDDEDRIADFSSRGPTDSGAIKPEITAPGVGIVAARAAGTGRGVPDNPAYASYDGTSMAAPHVAGAAALLLQQHPDWRAGLLKDALVSTATPTDGLSVYEQGAGRLQVDQASSQTVFASATADFGDLFGDQASRTREVSYTNVGSEPVTLTLDLALDRGATVPDGAVTVADAEIVVPARGTASTTITVDPSLGGLGRYNGLLRATADGVSVATAVGYVKQPPRRTVDFEFTGRDGATAGQVTLQIVDVETQDSVVRGARFLGERTYRTVLPEGRYAIQAILTTYDESRYVAAHDIFSEPDLVIDSDRTLRLDAREAEPVRAEVTDEDRPLADGPIAMHATVDRHDGSTIGVGVNVDLSDQTTGFGVIPSTTEAPQGTFDLVVDHELHDPLVTGRWAATGGDATGSLQLLAPQARSAFDGVRRLQAVAAGSGWAEDYAGLDVAGKLVVVRSNGWLAAKAAVAAEHGAAGILAVRSTPGPTLVQSSGQVPIIELATTYEDGQALLESMAAGPVTVTVSGRKTSRFTYRVPFHADGAIPADPTVTTTTGDYARLVNTFYGEGSPGLVSDATYAVYPWRASPYLAAGWHQTPGTRTDMVYADGAQYLQHINASPTGTTYFRDRPVSFEAGRTYRRDWGRAPMHPTVPLLIPCALCRTENGVSLVLAPYGDSDPNHFGADGARTSATYFRDDVQVPAAELFVPEEAEYRVDLQVERTQVGPSTLGIRSTTSFGFRSAAPAAGSSAPGCDQLDPGAERCAALPLVFPSYDLPLDLQNSAPAGRPFTFEVGATGPDGYDGGPVTEVTVEASYDDGDTWVDADRVKLAKDGTAQVQLRHPSRAQTNGFVSLRVSVRDGSGSHTEQTVVRAYALR